jgi:predicted secreted protein
MKMMNSIPVYLVIKHQIYFIFFPIDRRVFENDNEEEQYMELRSTKGSNETNTGNYIDFYSKN